MVSQVDIYYDKLLSTFGGINFQGAKTLATAMNCYEFGKAMKQIIQETAEVLGITPTACERNIRTYITYISSIKTMDELREMLDYPFIMNKITTAEFIPVLIRAFNK